MSHAENPMLGRFARSLPILLAVWLIPPAVAADELHDLPGVQANQAVAERWLFTHPSWLRWWTLPNLESHPQTPRLITGVFCVFVETASGNDSLRHRADVESRCRALGIEFVYGVRHSHAKGQLSTIPFDPDWHRDRVREFLKTGLNTWIMDSEPYYSGTRRYHVAAEALDLEQATEPWRHLGRGRLFIYPGGPEYVQYHGISTHARAGGTTVFAVDPVPFNPHRHKDVVALMRARTEDSRNRAAGLGVTYMPGFYLEFAVDERLMRHIAEEYGRCWFFGRTSGRHFDDQPRFGTPSWKWFQKHDVAATSATATNVSVPASDP